MITGPMFQVYLDSGEVLVVVFAAELVVALE